MPIAKTGLDRLLGPSPKRLTVLIQCILIVGSLLALNEFLVRYVIPGYYQYWMVSTTELFAKAYAARASIAVSLQASFWHVLIGLLISPIGFLIGARMGTWRYWIYIIAGFAGMLISYPKLAVMILLSGVLTSKVIAIYFFSIWVATILSFAVGFWKSWDVTEGRSLATSQGSRDLAILYHHPKRSRFFWLYVFPYVMPEIFIAVRIATGVLCGTLIFTEAYIRVPGLGEMASYHASDSLDIALFHSAALLIGGLNLFFLAVIELFSQRLHFLKWGIAKIVDWQLGRKKVV